MLRLLAVVTGLALLVVAFTAAGKDSDEPTNSVDADIGTVTLGVSLVAPQQRPPLPELAGATVDGSEADVAALSDHIVVINAWASWCEPCQEELPLLAAEARSAADASGTPVRFVGLNVKDDAATARAMAADVPLPYLSLIDDDGSMLASIPGVPPTAIPSTVIVDSRGRVAAKVIGVLRPGMLKPVLDELRAE